MLITGIDPTTWQLTLAQGEPFRLRVRIRARRPGRFAQLPGDAFFAFYGIDGALIGQAIAAELTITDATGPFVQFLLDGTVTQNPALAGATYKLVYSTANGSVTVFQGPVYLAPGSPGVPSADAPGAPITQLIYDPDADAIPGAQEVAVLPIGADGPAAWDAVHEVNPDIAATPQAFVAEMQRPALEAAESANVATQNANTAASLAVQKAAAAQTVVDAGSDILAAAQVATAAETEIQSLVDGIEAPIIRIGANMIATQALIVQISTGQL